VHKVSAFVALLGLVASTIGFPAISVSRGPSPVIRTARFVGSGAALQDSKRWLFFYHWTDSPGEPYAWWPQVAQSFDEGQTWEDYGPVRMETPKADHVWIQSALVWQGVPWIFYHWHEPDTNTWRIGGARSPDGRTWEPVQLLLPAGQTILTNPAVVAAEDRVYLFASECVDKTFQLRLFRAEQPEGPYEDVALAVPLGTAPWCEWGAWDACPVKLPSGRWLLWFSGCAGPPPNRSNTSLGYALADTIEGPYVVQTEPSFRHSTALGGRTAGFYRRDRTITLYSDAFFGGGSKQSMALLTFTVREGRTAPTSPAGPGPAADGRNAGS
jgi:hypothetical protein